MLPTTVRSQAIRVYNYTKLKGLDLRKITSMSEIKKVMRTWRVISIIAENEQHAHHKAYLHIMKVYNTHYGRFAT